MNKRSILYISTLFALALGVTGLKPASATDATSTFTFLGASTVSKSINISENSGSSFMTGPAGIYSGTLGGNNVKLYCVDLSHDVSNGNSFTANAAHLITQAASSSTTTISGNKYYTGGLASAMGSTDFKSTNSSAMSFSARASQVAWLADNFQNLAAFGAGAGTTDAATNQAAVNIAIWDIVQDGGDGTHAGTTQLSSASNTSFSTYVSYYETLAASHSSYTSTTAYFVQAPLNVAGANGTSHYQDFVYSTALPTPEAGTAIAMGVLFLGAMFLRRRTSSGKVSAATA